MRNSQELSSSHPCNHYITDFNFQLLQRLKKEQLFLNSQDITEEKFASNKIHRNSAQVYDAPTDTWTTKASTIYGRQGTSTVVIQGRIITMGGLGTNETKVVEEYLPASNKW